MSKKGDKRRFIPYLVIAFLSILVYVNALNNAFQYDDEPDIVRNTFLEKWENIPRFFTSFQFYRDENLRTDHYRPLLYLTYSLNKIAGGNDPFGYHVVNLAFHVGSAMLLFMIIKAMLGSGGWVALTAALIFAVHPFNSEAVNYITARSSLMSGFFYLLAFYCWVMYRKVAGSSEQVANIGSSEQIAGSRKNLAELGGSSQGDSNGFKGFPATRRYPLPATYYVVSLIAFLLGMLSKEVVITLPIVLWLYDFYFVHPLRTPHSVLRTLFNWRTYLPYLPFVLVVVAPAFVVRIIYWGRVVPSFKRSLLVQLYTELPALVKYLKLFIFPTGLNVDHYQDIYRSFFEWPVIVSALILLLYLLLAVVAYRSGSVVWRVLSFFMIWFFIVLLPTIVIPLNAIFQENRGYLASIVFAVIAGVMLNEMKIPPPLTGGGEGEGERRVFSDEVKRYVSMLILIALVLCYGAGTVYRNSVWRNGISLWSDAVAKSPESSRAHTNLGTEYARREMNEAAIQSFSKALRLSESDSGAEPVNIHYNLGTVYQQMNWDDMAVKEYRAVIDLNPSDFRPWYNLGVIFQQKGDVDAAMNAYKMVIERNRNHFKSYHNLGLLYHNRNEPLLAAEYYRKALSINPNYVRSRVNLAEINKKTGAR